MTYAKGRTYYDADSHIMELPDFLRDFADSALKAEIKPINYSASVVTDEEVAVIVEQGGRHSDEHLHLLRNLGDDLIRGPKEIQALGAFDGKHRSEALDMLGFEKQLVFATHSVVLPFSLRKELRLRYAGAAAHNRAMQAFVGDDVRLMGVAAIPLDDPEMACAELDHALRLGLKAAWIPHRDCGGRSPGHPDLDPFWARLVDAQVPFVMHIGGTPLHLPKAWANNGQRPGNDWLGGGENLRAKDMVVLHHGPETFISSMVLDGVFERFRGLKGASVELGAGWVPNLLERLDITIDIWSRADKGLANMSRKPSQQITEQMAFTPFVHEDVGEFIRRSNDELYLFSSDYPHIEGGRNPIGRFERSLGDLPAISRDRFYADNFSRVMA